MINLAHLKQLLEQDPPAVHGVGTYGVSWDATEAISRFVSPGMTTAETGAGISTIVFAGLGARHLAITPTKDEGAIIREWLRSHGLATDLLAFDHRLSWDALPALSGLPLDFALIDGCHGFPTPFIDFFYLNRNLKVGGVLAIDDVPIWTGKVLVQFLRQDAAWEFLSQVGKTAFFRKRREIEWNEWEWDKQPFVVGHSQPALTGRFAKVLDLIRRATRHLVAGDWVKLRRGFREVFGKKLG